MNLDVLFTCYQSDLNAEVVVRVPSLRKLRANNNFKLFIKYVSPTISSSNES
jgi:hypothetical protein